MYEDGTELFQAATSEAESYDYLRSLPGAIHGLLSVSCRLPGQAEATYARVWRNKAAVARALTAATGRPDAPGQGRPRHPANTRVLAQSSAARSPDSCWPPPTAAPIPTGSSGSGA